MKKLLLFGVLASFGAMGYATEIAAPEPAAAPAETTTEVAAPAPQQQSGWQQVLDKLPKVSGYLQTGYNYNSFGKGTSSFEAKRLRLIMDGNVGPRVSFRLQIEAFNGIAGSTNGNGQKNLQVMDAFATYKFSDAFSIRAGQFYTPLGYENYDISPATLETVDFSNICYRMACRNALTYNFVDYGRDLGVMLMGDLFPSQQGFKYLSYNFAVTNGTLPCKADNNKSKDIIAALTIRPVQKFNVKLSYQWSQSKTIGGESTEPLPFYLNYNRAVFGAWYNDPNGWDLRAEYGLGIAKKNDVDYVKESGAYVLAGYHIGKWLPVVRWDMFKDDTNKTSAGLNYNRILLGTTWQPLPNLKIQLNYLLSMYSGDAKEIGNHGESTSSQLLLMGLFKF